MAATFWSFGLPSESRRRLAGCRSGRSGKRVLSSRPDSFQRTTMRWNIISPLLSTQNNVITAMMELPLARTCAEYLRNQGKPSFLAEKTNSISSLLNPARLRGRRAPCAAQHDHAAGIIILVFHPHVVIGRLCRSVPPRVSGGAFSVAPEHTFLPPHPGVCEKMYAPQCLQSLFPNNSHETHTTVVEDTRVKPQKLSR